MSPAARSSVALSFHCAKGGNTRIALRKLLEAVEKEILKKPDRKTLDHLSLLAGFQDWKSFQDALHGDVSADENYK